MSMCTKLTPEYVCTLHYNTHTRTHAHAHIQMKDTIRQFINKGNIWNKYTIMIKSGLEVSVHLSYISEVATK